MDCNGLNRCFFIGLIGPIGLIGLIGRQNLLTRRLVGSLACWLAMWFF